MPRYIDADAFIKEQCNSCDGACEALPCDCLNCDSDCRCDMIKDLLNAPTISPDEVRGVGKWLDDVGEFGIPEIPCSVCGYKSGRYGFKYCPHCGAKMEVSEDA